MMVGGAPHTRGGPGRRLRGGGGDPTSQPVEPGADLGAEGRGGHQNDDGNGGDQQAVFDDVLPILVAHELHSKFHQVSSFLLPSSAPTYIAGSAERAAKPIPIPPAKTLQTPAGSGSPIRLVFQATHLLSGHENRR